MIHFNPETRTFNLLLKTSFYAFQADPEGCLVHLGWGPRPGGEDHLVSGRSMPFPYTGAASFEGQLRPDELVTFGDATYHEVGLKVSFPSLGQPLAAGEAANLPVRDVRLRYAGHEIGEDARPGLAPEHGLPTRETSPRQTLRVLLRDPVQPLQVTLCYRLTPEQDILERWTELENLGQEPITAEALAFASLHFPNGTTELTSVNGAWANEFNTQRERLPVGLRVIEGRTVQTSHSANPFFLLNRPGQAWEETGTVYFGLLAYSGSWRMSFDHLSTHSVRFQGGYNPFDFELVLAPGERHTTPALVCGVSGEGWGGASRRLHAFALGRILPDPPRPSPYRPVLYNSWEATYFDLSVAGQIELARKAARIGVELFCLDDGWFGARRSDRAGLGDWTVSTEVFPQGLEPLVEEVHNLGMRFGLWVEPEMVNPDSDLYRLHPDWVLHFPGRPRTEARHQLILDLGRPEVVEHIFGALDALMRRYRIDFFKWDMNRSASEPGSPSGKAIWRRHVEGLYGIIDRLRAKYPGLDIQSCSGGGGRIDLGILGRTDQVWTSDNTDALDRIRIQEGYSLAYPARAMEAWVTHDKNHQTGRILPLSLRFDVAMRGTLGIGTSLNELGDDELAEYARYITFYKRIRRVVQSGRLYRLQRLEEFGASVIEYVLEDGSEAVYSVAVREHQINQFRPPAPLRGLVAGAEYTVTDRDEKQILRTTGYELMTLGIPGDGGSGQGFSRTLHLKRV